MSKKTIIDYFPNILNHVETINDNLFFSDYNNSNASQHQNINRKKRINNRNLVGSLVQKNLEDIIREKEYFDKIPRLLEGSWTIIENGLGFTDDKKIVIFSTVRKLKETFFKKYKIKDFVAIINKNIINYKTSLDFVEIGEASYNSYYLSLICDVLNGTYELYQHPKILLLYIKNEKYGAIICPKF